MPTRVEFWVNCGPGETRVARLEDERLQSLWIERSAAHGNSDELVGSIFKGRVNRVLPALQAAFVDAGLTRSAFLHADDLVPRENQASADIAAQLRPGDDIIVQVIKPPSGDKGARLTTDLSLPGSYIVYRPYRAGIGVSTRIVEEAERERLRQLLHALWPADLGGGAIVRTAAAGVDRDALLADLLRLQCLWEPLRVAALTAQPGTCLHRDESLLARLLRDAPKPQPSRVVIDSAAECARLREQLARQPHFATLDISLYEDARPIFDCHRIEVDISEALQRRVPLPSGGNIVMTPTEAMVTIDVNSGSAVGHGERTALALATNLEAAGVLAQQLRLRGLAGLIVIDFIDMSNSADRQSVLSALHAATANDRDVTHISPFSPLGLVELARRRLHPSLEQTLCESCPTCDGNAVKRSPETLCREIFRDILRRGRQPGSAPLTIIAAPAVVTRLQNEDAGWVQALQTQLQVPLRLQAEVNGDLDAYEIRAG